MSQSRHARTFRPLPVVVAAFGLMAGVCLVWEDGRNLLGKAWSSARENVMHRGEREAAWWNQRGHEYLHQDIGMAMEAFAKALEFDNRQANYHMDLANCLVLYRKDAMRMLQADEQQVFDRVIALLEDAKECAPRDLDLAREIGITYYLIRPLRPAPARAAWVSVQRNSTTAFDREEAALHLARIDLLDGRFDAAFERLQEVTLEEHREMQETLYRAIVHERRRSGLPMLAVWTEEQTPGSAGAKGTGSAEIPDAVGRAIMEAGVSSARRYPTMLALPGSTASSTGVVSAGGRARALLRGGSPHDPWLLETRRAWLKSERKRLDESGV
jgi:tetratricopeptide (TPR) repeat protein